MPGLIQTCGQDCSCAAAAGAAVAQTMAISAPRRLSLPAGPGRCAASRVLVECIGNFLSPRSRPSVVFLWPDFTALARPAPQASAGLFAHGHQFLGYGRVDADRGVELALGG